MRRLQSLLLAVCLAALCAAQAVGRTGAVRTRTSKSIVTVGDTLTYHVDVIAPAGAGVLFGPPAPELGEFDVLRRVTRPKRELAEGMALWAEEYVVAVYSPGIHYIPPVEVSVVDSDGSIWPLVGDSVEVAVRSVLDEGETELRDIKGLVTRPGRGIRPWMIAGAAAVAAAIALWLWRRRRPALVRAVMTPTIPPDAVALRRLDELMKAGLLESGGFKEFYTELSDILRGYISARHDLPAPEMTTTEIARAMEARGVPRAFRSDTCRILDESDVVKFANADPGVERAYKTAMSARSLIERSGPAEEERPEALAS